MTGLGPHQLTQQPPPNHCASIYVWIYENRANIKRTTLTLFQENTQAFSINQAQAADSWPLSLTDENAFICNPPHAYPQGLGPEGPTDSHAGNRDIFPNSPRL